MTASDFATVYAKNVWNGVESLSGPGSGSVATRNVVPELLRIIDQYAITSVLDIGCGDGFWMPDLPGYLGVDHSVAAIAVARQRHPRRGYLATTLTRAGAFDLVIVRDVIQHLPLTAGLALVEMARDAGRYLLASTYVGGTNTGIGRPALLRGGSYANDLEGPPFSLGAPLEVIPDGWSYDEPVRIRDATKRLGLWKT